MTADWNDHREQERLELALERRQAEPDAPLPIDPRTGEPFATWREWSDYRTQSEQRQRDANADSYDDWRRRTRAEIQARIDAVGFWQAVGEYDRATLLECGFGN